ncbi:MAG: LysE family transporter [Dehalococcoidia bacterium]
MRENQDLTSALFGLAIPCYTDAMPEALPEASLAVIFSTSFVVALSGALMPGPVLALTISGVAKRGFRAAPLIIAGHALLELALVIALVFGLSRFIDSDFIASIIGIVGGSVLIGIGAMTAIKGRNAQNPLSSPPTYATRDHMLVMSGVVLSLSNPYWFLWWATIGLTYLLWSLKLGTAGVATFFVGHTSGDFAWHAVVALVIITGRRFINDAAYRWMLIVCGVALVGLGIYFIISGARFLMAPESATAAVLSTIRG